MRTSLYLSILAGLIVFCTTAQRIAAAQTASAAYAQAASSAAIASVEAKAPSVEEPVVTAPVELSIPSIRLDDPVVPVGTNGIGQMDVPDGATSDVGWYEYGTLPGQEGSAVLDAHVFAAFKNLRYAKVGDSVYVKEQDGQTLRFVIRSSMVYRLADVPAKLLFNRTGGDYLNIITCAGTYQPSLNTYDHRLVEYAELVNE